MVQKRATGYEGRSSFVRQVVTLSHNSDRNHATRRSDGNARGGRSPIKGEVLFSAFLRVHDDHFADSEKKPRREDKVGGRQTIRGRKIRFSTFIPF